MRYGMKNDNLIENRIILKRCSGKGKGAYMGAGVG